MNMEEIPNIKPREKESPAHSYSEGIKYENFKLCQIIETKLRNIEDARTWSVDLSYPYPESHAIWIGKEKVLKELLEELNLRDQDE